VPQEGFLFEGTIAQNVAYGAANAGVGINKATISGTGGTFSDDAVAQAFEDLGLGDWLAELPGGVQTEVGQRGEQLSAGERQLVALVRAYVAGPELLVLDEATSAVDPATEVRIARALEHLTAGRTTLTIAYRLSTAEAADLVVVVDKAKIVQVGTCAELLATPGEFNEMYEVWQQQIAAEGQMLESNQ
jgi:ABC-type multidrug transport system fused ATPase/permease subunit